MSSSKSSCCTGAGCACCTGSGCAGCWRRACCSRGMPPAATMDCTMTVQGLALLAVPIGVGLALEVPADGDELALAALVEDRRGLAEREQLEPSGVAVAAVAPEVRGECADRERLARLRCEFLRVAAEPARTGRRLRTEWSCCLLGLHVECPTSRAGFRAPRRRCRRQVAE